jgi:hypothetical protein
VEQQTGNSRGGFSCLKLQNDNLVKLSVSLILFFLPLLTVFAANTNSPVPRHIQPCLESLPTLPRTSGKSSIVVLDRGNECAILILFELQSDLENYRRARIRAKLSPDSIKYKNPDGSVLEIKLELRKSAVW